MIFYLLITTYLLLFTILTWKKFHWGLFVFFLLLPTYLIRFNLGPLPTTLLEVMLWIIIIVWVIKYHSHIMNHVSYIIKQNKLLFIGIILFLLSATISIFTSSNLRAALGEWKAFYIEPILLFATLITNYELLITKKFLNTIIFALVLSGLVTSIFAIIQHFTGYLVPYAFWQNQNTFRVTGWYGFPNAVGLFLAPLVPLAIYLIKKNWKLIKNFKIQDTNKLKNLNIKYSILNIICILFLVSSILAIIYSKGTGPLIGVLSGIGFLLLMYKKTRWLTLAVGLISVICFVSLPQLSNTKNEILLQDRSCQIRIGIWQEATKFLADHPIVGAGLASYTEKIVPYHKQVNGENIEIFHHPHNIFLTMWVNLGLLGLISFLLILFCFFKISFCNLKFEICNQKTIKPSNPSSRAQCAHYGAGHLTIYLLSSLIIILVMGLVDSPYIKNDLAILFWLLPALLITNSQSQSVLSIK